MNASGGTAEQNADLARQTSKQIEGMMRTVVHDELMKQMRPGNMLATRYGVVTRARGGQSICRDEAERG